MSGSRCHRQRVSPNSVNQIMISRTTFSAAVGSGRSAFRCFVQNPWDAIPVTITLLTYLIVLFFSPPAIISGDSAGYKNPSVAHDFDRVLGAITGDSIRQVIPVSVNEVLGDYRLIIVMQIIAMAAASAYLVFGFSTLDLPKPARLAIGLIAAVIVASPMVIGLSVHILSEAWTLILTMCALGALIRVANANMLRKRTILTLILAGAGMGLMRVQLLPLWLLFLIATWYLAAPNRSPRLVLAIIISGVVGSAGILGWWQNNNSSWQSNGAGRDIVSLVYQLSDYSPISGDVVAAWRTDRPPPACFPKPLPLPADPLVLTFTDIQAISSCASAQRWANLFQRRYSLFLLSHPRLLYRYLSWSVPRSLSNSIFVSDVVPVPRPISELFMGSTSAAMVSTNGTTYSAGRSAEPIIVQDIVYLEWLFACLCIIGGWRAWRKSLWFPQTLVAFLSATLALAITAAVSVAMPSTIIEMARIGSPTNLTLRISLLWACALLVGHITRSVIASNARGADAN